MSKLAIVLELWLIHDGVLIEVSLLLSISTSLLLEPYRLSVVDDYDTFSSILSLVFLLVMKYVLISLYFLLII